MTASYQLSGPAPQRTRASAFGRFLRSPLGRRLAREASGKPADGWKRGGCLVLAEGVQAWLGAGECQILGLWRHGPPSRPEIVPHHVFVLAHGRYLDGNGALGRTSFEAAWARDGTVDFAIAYIAPYDADAMGPTIIRRDLAASAAITRALRAALDPEKAARAL